MNMFEQIYDLMMELYETTEVDMEVEISFYSGGNSQEIKNVIETCKLENAFSTEIEEEHYGRIVKIETDLGTINLVVFND